MNLFRSKTTTPIHCPPLRRAFVLIPLVLACVAFLPTAQAVSPAPDGGYPGNNTAEGTNALLSRTTGVSDTAIGAAALLSDNTGSSNTAVGFNSLRLLTSGGSNTAVGVSALQSNNGSSNTAVGVSALSSNTTNGNVAVGFQAANHTTTGGTPSGTPFSQGEVGPNTAVGDRALVSNIDGGSNTAVGYLALSSIVTGVKEGANTTKGGYSTAVGFEALGKATNTFNDAFGYQALAHLTTGQGNVAVGALSLFSATGEMDNTAVGVLALSSTKGGHDNTAVGVHALVANTTGSFNTAVGEFALEGNTSGRGNIALGAEAGTAITTGDNNIDIGNGGVPGDNNIIRIGSQGLQTATYIAGIGGTGTFVSGPTVAVAVDTGQLGVQAVSSARFKDKIKPMDKESQAILAFKPVTFCYKKELDPKGIPQFGLVAEDVEKVNPDLITRDREGKPYTVRYEAVNAMLLNEFLKEHQTVQNQQKEIDALKAELKEQRAFIQRVNDKVELSKPAPQTVLNQ